MEVKIQESIGIYVIQNTVNNKKYIGSSITVKSRLQSHISVLKNNKHGNRYLQNSWDKHGSNNFICYLLENCKKEELTIREQYWIDTLQPEYNITTEVVRNTPSEESKKLISKTLKEKYSSGEIVSKSFKKVSCYNLSGEYITTYNSLNEAAKDLKIHVSSIIRVLNKKYFQVKGYQFRYRKLKKIKSVKASKIKPISQYDLKGNKIKDYNSTKEASLELGIHIQLISDVLTKRHPHTHSFIFKYQ